MTRAEPATKPVGNCAAPLFVATHTLIAPQYELSYIKVASHPPGAEALARGPRGHGCFAEENIRSAFDHAQKLVRAKDMQEVLSLQSEFVKAQMSALQDQAKQLGSSLQGAAQSAMHSASDLK